jgi:hypothetical protein
MIPPDITSGGEQQSEPRLNSRITRWRSATALLCAVSMIGCDESLPPRADPPVVLVASVKATTRLVVFDADTVKGGGAFDVQVRNVYDEVLSEEARIRADITVRLTNPSDSSCSVASTAEDLWDSRMLHNNIFTIGVGDTMRLVHPWDHRFQGGTPIYWKNVRFEPAMTPDGRGYYRSDTLYVFVTGKVQMFERVQAIDLPPTVIPFVYLLFNMPAPPNPAPQSDDSGHT